MPLAAHASATTEALEAGLHVLVEKPFTETIAEAQRARRARPRTPARADGQPELSLVSGGARARQLLEDGAIGLPLACYLDFHFLFGTGYRYFFLEEPLLSDMAIHHFDTLRFVLRTSRSS